MGVPTGFIAGGLVIGELIELDRSPFELCDREDNFSGNCCLACWLEGVLLELVELTGDALEETDVERSIKNRSEMHKVPINSLLEVRHLSFRRSLAACTSGLSSK